MYFLFPFPILHTPLILLPLRPGQCGWKVRHVRYVPPLGRFGYPAATLSHTRRPPIPRGEKRRRRGLRSKSKRVKLVDTIFQHLGVCLLLFVPNPSVQYRRVYQVYSSAGRSQAPASSVSRVFSLIAICSASLSMSSRISHSVLYFYFSYIPHV